MIALFPAGFEEVERGEAVELAAYTDAAGEERVWQVFGGAVATDVESGWEDRWRAFHRPTWVGRLWVGPPWERPPEGVPAVVIDPGRAFGTGRHATTRLCLELLQELDGGGSLLDIGCGSGVLAIAGALLGFAPVAAVDVDAAAIEATRANARANRVEVAAALVAADAPLPHAATAVANISLDGVCDVAPRIDARVFVTSGYLPSAEPAFEGWRRIRRLTADGWAADVHRRR